VLVCEDDDDVAALVVDMLTQLGYAPTRVTSAAAALGALADGREVDLLFTDVMMPGGMDGLALAREAGRRRPGLAVLLTTGYTGGPASEPIGVPVLRKPYRIDDLARALERVLEQHAIRWNHLIA
jgi:CheY-like chemotaxis protein